jgi:outer membrane protein assembly factor BamB
MRHKALSITVPLFLAVALILLTAGCATPSGNVTPTPTVTTPPSGPGAGAIPPEVTQYAKDWPLPHRDYANSRATMDSTINSNNVNTLGVAWVHNVPSGTSTYGSISCTPVILGSTVYLTDLGNNFMALDLDTGNLKWQTVENLANLGPNGPAVGYGKIFGSVTPYEVAALDLSTGNEIWRVNLADIQGGNSGIVGIDMQGTVYDDMFYISTVPGNAGVFYAGGAQGVLFALDQATGKVMWNFSTLNTTDYWGHPEINSGGGTWFPPAIDTQTGDIFWGIANPAPYPGQPKGGVITRNWPNGESHPGNNLYTDSVMSFDHKTGALNWYNQVWPHDISDYDLQQAPVLGISTYNDVQQDIVIGAGKMGRVYAFNRDTGALLWAVAVGDHENDNLAAFPTDGSINVTPGFYGGVESPMAYADGVVYVATNNLGMMVTNGLTATIRPFSEGTGDLVAIDVNTGHILWDKRLPSALFGGATVVNDLVFTGTFDGMLYAFNRNTGAQVWSYQAPAAVNAWPAVAGDTLVWAIAGPGGPTSVLGFRLHETAPVLTIVDPKAGAALPAGSLTVQTEVNNFKLVDKLGKPNVPGEGHLHYFLDVAAPTEQGKPAIPTSGVWAATTSTTYTFQNVSAGPHQISVELVNNNHTPLNPPVVATVSITADLNPRIKIVQPRNGYILKTGDVTMTVQVTNFDLVNKLGQANAPGEGHIHYFMDVMPPTTPGQPAIPPSGSIWAATPNTSYTFSNVSVGTHSFYVELVNNDHTPLQPPVTDEIQLFIVNFTGGFALQ